MAQCPDCMGAGESFPMVLCKRCKGTGETDEFRESATYLIAAVRELLDNRNVDYLHRDDREMLKEALLPLEQLRGEA